MSNIKIFNFNENHNVRIAIDDNNQPLFCLFDVCKILLLSNSTEVAKRLDENYLRKIEVVTTRGTIGLWFIGEPNVYRVIFRSNKAEAKKFQDWVFNEVLPTIRKTGSYSVQKPQTTGPRQIAPAEFAMIQKAIDGLSRYVGLSNNQLCTNLYRYFRQQFNLNDLMQMNVEQLRQALEFIASVSKQAHATWMKFSREQYNLFFSIVNPKRVLPPWQAEVSA